MENKINNEVLNGVFNVSKNEEIYDLIMADIKKKELSEVEILNKYLLFFWNPDTSLHSVRNKYTNIRKYINESRIALKRKKDFLEVFSIPTNVLNLLNARNGENTMKRIENKVAFGADDYIEKMNATKEIIKSKDFSSVRVNRQTDDYVLANLSAIYIAMNTGRRTFEIFKTLEVSKLGKTTYYGGLIKKRGESEEEKFEAHLLDDDYKFLKSCVENIREYYKFEDIDNPKFNNNYQTNLNKFVSRYFGEKLTYSKLRDMYVAVSKKLYLKDGEDENHFISKILNHKAYVSTQDHYKKTKAE